MVGILVLKDGWGIQTARLRRRGRRLKMFAWAALIARPDAQALTPFIWMFVGGWLGLASGLPTSPDFVLVSFILFVLLGIIAMIDSLYFVVPDGPLLGLAVVAALSRPPEVIVEYLGSGLGAYVMFWLFGWSYKVLSGRAGLGGGDVRLLAISGFWLGGEGLLSCLLTSTLSALLSAALAWRNGKLARRDDPLPFGPHIALGFWLTWMFGPLTV
ncbi:leader peptidase (prepilin peptidase) / N-methyltransferase [Rhodoblastus acidophilus]|uniref:Leader peptidase (Prepilin peptidase) / N-methyltransferase n=1 Tax=Rhodoblastus acidophilus TaxID=1074 RepID=A0A212SAZ5_RHOAC|nr:A24 family peptidase [Rhodoblastus acidophilus]MCW2318881.1 leader peptidase (prepilin peptidase)/N-methyltransferase [Rhodoblastus acidophilus]PPQ35756.1 prepilin peptidase [Rhodoblastus acidophilus]RAI20004.1 prepilin peptidase [Rhodoblastus acidophilus]SNB82539.1 leader peptidase (prepilin peptidase) / N-methyltransferase [Rhodoblastus acidophilus]